VQLEQQPSIRRDLPVFHLGQVVAEHPQVTPHNILEVLARLA
jgi:hypothetical protein